MTDIVLDVKEVAFRYNTSAVAKALSAAKPLFEPTPHPDDTYIKGTWDKWHDTTDEIANAFQKLYPEHFNRADFLKDCGYTQ